MDETISREATMNAIDQYLIGRELNTDGETLARILNETVIKRLQPVTPRRGRWIQTAHQIERICSYCGHVEPYKFAEDDVDIYNFCPHCGADMRGGQDEHRARGTNIEQEKMIVETLPSVYPMMQRFEEEALKTVLDALPKTGKWVDDGDPLMFTCGNCGYGVMRYNNTPFCPNCGAKMERRTVAIVGRGSGKSAAQLEAIKKKLGFEE